MKITIFRSLSAIIAIYHILLACIGLFLSGESLEKFTSAILGFSPSFSEDMELVSRFTSAYLLVFGVMMLMLAWNPIKHKAMLIPALILFGVRLVNRALYFTSVTDVFEIDTVRNGFGLACLAIFFFGLLFTKPNHNS